MISAVISALSIATIASADTAAPKSGDWVRTSDGFAIGRIQYVDKAKDGAAKDVGVIYDMRIVHIPAETLTAGDKGLVTSLSRADVSKLK
jgi:hypothetical protein